MGGRPSQGTSADGRLKENQPSKPAGKSGGSSKDKMPKGATPKGAMPKGKTSK